MNARDNIKPKTIRLAILLALADGAITTIDDLQIRMDEPREKVARNVHPAASEGLIKRLRDDVTSLPAYQITAKGREHLASFGGGKAEVAEVPTCPESQVDAITPCVKTDIPAAPACPVMAIRDPVVGTISNPEIAAKDDEIETLCIRLHTAYDALELERNEAAQWRDMAKVFGCTTPGEIADRISGLDTRVATFNRPLVVGYVIQRAGKPLVRVTKAEKAEARALAFARGGKRANVFALVPAGSAKPGAEWVTA